MGLFRSTWGTLEKIKREKLIILNHNKEEHSLMLQSYRGIGGWV